MIRRTPRYTRPDTLCPSTTLCRSHLHTPADMPDANHIDYIEQPWIEAGIYCPDEYLGSILKLCQDRRGIQKNLTYVGGRAQVTYELPLNEVVFDFYDRLKSISRG